MAVQNYLAGIPAIGQDLPQVANMLYQRQANEQDNALRARAMGMREQEFAQGQQQFQAQQQTQQQEQALREKYAEMEALTNAPPEYKAQYVETQKQKYPNFAQTPFASMPPEQAFEAMRRGLAAKLGMTVPQAPGPIQSQRIDGVTFYTQDGKVVANRMPPSPQRLDPTADERDFARYSRMTPEQRALYDRMKGRDPNSKAAPNLPVGALRLVDDANQALAATGESDAIVTNAISALEKGEVNLGPIDNTVSRARNATGMSSKNSRAYADLRQTLEKLRNNYLLLAKGVQTEGDAQRAWNSEIGENVQNDNKLALQQLKKAKAMLDRAKAAQQNRINAVYKNYGGAAPSPASSGPVDFNSLPE